MCFLCQKPHSFLKKYPKISTGVNPEILIQCRPNIFALFKKAQDFDKQKFAIGFWRQKHGSYEVPQDFDRC